MLLYDETRHVDTQFSIKLLLVSPSEVVEVH